VTKDKLHPRNIHRDRYNFSDLVLSSPELKTSVIKNKFNNEETINFSDPVAVKLLNKALLKLYYEVTYWDIPPNNLCPPIPGRADYIHYVADLLAEMNNGIIPTGKNIQVLDIGVGANGIYPLIGQHQYDWNFVGSDIDKAALTSLKKVIEANPGLHKKIELRLQDKPAHIFLNLISVDEKYDLTICNPPFHASAKEAQAGTSRKIQNLGLKKKDLNFGGKHNELWCPGGEAEFINKMIKESASFKNNCLWFTTLVSKKENLSGIYGELKRVKVTEVKTVEMAQGQKTSRFVAWTFISKLSRNEWRKERWI